MRARLITYLLTSAPMMAVAIGLRSPLLDGTDGRRLIAYQTLAGVGAALFTVQLAMLAFFIATARGSRLRRVLVRSKGSGAATLAADTLAALTSALGFAVIIVIDGIDPELGVAVAGGLLGLQLGVGLGVTRITYFVMRTVEQDALEEAQREYTEAGRRFEAVTPSA